ncbi:MAG: hypothetical protein K2J80_02660 [Oscillospiraceae bacterium]|nr:hypothetical protein [Oscillospiraceae bacterium]
MFGLFKKAAKSVEEKRAESLPLTKKVQFDPIPIDQAQRQLDADIRAILGYSPVNYYATKDSYLLCIFYYSEDYGEIYMRLEFRANDIPKGKTRLYTLDKELMRDILRKFGQNI